MAQRTRLHVVVVVLLLGGLTPTSTATPSTLPPLVVGDSADYSGPTDLSFEVSGERLVVDGVAEHVAGFTLHTTIQGRTTEFNLGRSSMVAESVVSHCQRSTGGKCDPWSRVNWDLQGVPGIFGATLLQGRTLMAGDRWVVDGDCRACEVPIRVEIQEPDAASPAGTDLVAVVTARFKDDPSTALFLDGARLHVALDSPFPLRMDTAAGSWTLDRLTRGPGPALEVDRIVPRSYAPVGVPARSVDGLPPEGVPLAGFPSWQEARRAAVGPLPSLVREPHMLTYTFYGPIGVAERGVGSRHFEVVSHHAAQSGTVETTWRGEEPVRGPLPPGLRAWTSGQGVGTPASWDVCIDDIVPLWDAVRIANDSGVLADFTGFRAFFACQGGYLTVFGAFYGEGSLRESEQLVIDLRTGLLAFAILPDERLP